MNLALYILLFLHLHRSTLTSSYDAEPPMMFPSAACTDELVIFSSCLPFVGAFPNNRTEFPPPQCCDDVADAFADGSSICLCYLILEPDILGFPLNSSKLLSLTSICPRRDQTLEANFSLQKVCSESAALPPLRSITGSSNPKPHNIVSESPPPQEPSASPTEEPADESPHQANSSKPLPVIGHWLRVALMASILLFHFSISCQLQYINNFAELF